MIDVICEKITLRAVRLVWVAVLLPWIFCSGLHPTKRHLE
ncbi:hypothetical protein Cabys_3263 [Caldithrix abyssi DSM 13497]|uniref:Uncharacterized protein n=1 Tax=Caldithrix abyssi DSM 13497 TaxID=880073 RepID=A0A1J1CBC0_CALAY|nr:hypothetical protein Cabys_3263 [Caldithrix abyssi DSM 13497]